ncbi:MAG: EamA family transporter RarD [Rhodospirillaceae bacterium]
MAEQGIPRSEENAGIAYAVGAYVLWGFLPLYWWLLHEVGAVEMTAHRILWCVVLLGLLTVVRGRTAEIVAILRTPSTRWTLFITSLLITVNWTLFMYALVTDQLVESALGYYMTPVISFAFGILILHERPSGTRLFAVGLATCGVLVQVIAFGRLPWIALGLAVTFGLYGYGRKRAPVAALDGLLIETALVLPVAVALIAWWYVRGEGLFLIGDLKRDVLLVVGGALTIAPLALFAAAMRRVRMTTMGFLQYMGPTISLLLAVFGFGEPFDLGDLVSFGFIWAAIAIAAFDGITSTKGPGTPEAA